MTKRVGIATITNVLGEKANYNYGNVLQNYALQRFLRENGCLAETVLYASSVPESTRRMKPGRDAVSGVVQFADDCLRVAKRRLFRRKIETLKAERREDIRRFMTENLCFSKEVYAPDSDFGVLNDRYDCMITGSDQVWNPYYEGSNAFYYLGFMNAAGRIAYAPSFGVDHIPKDMVAKYRAWLGGLSAVSVRESAGREMLKQTFGIDAKLVCDPVFLLNRRQWDEKAVSPDERGRYFAVYLLGKKTVEKKRVIRRLEKRFHARAVDLYTADDPGSKFAGIGEFLGLLRNAAFVCTDSFHATAFSVIYQRPVVTMARGTEKGNRAYDMSSRITGLLDAAGAGRRDAGWILAHPEALEAGCENANGGFRRHIDESKAYLLGALGLKECENDER